MLHVIDHGSLDARGSIAFDAAIFAALEQRRGGETLRLWESPRTAVVVGFSAVIERQVDEPVCLRDQVPIIRPPGGNNQRRVDLRIRGNLQYYASPASGIYLACRSSGARWFQVTSDLQPSRRKYGLSKEVVGTLVC